MNKKETDRIYDATPDLIIDDSVAMTNCCPTCGHDHTSKCKDSDYVRGIFFGGFCTLAGVFIGMLIRLW